MTAAESELNQETAASARAHNRERVKLSQDIAAGIAHELRNPVLAVSSAAQLLRYRITDDPVVEKNIGRILREVERLNSLISALLDYGRPPAVDLTPADPDHVWTTVISAHRGELESRALLIHHTPAHPRATCAIDTEQFAEACSNALSNAIDAAPEGSDLTISSGSAEHGAWSSRLHNDGPAIPPSLLASVFEPLVGTKPGHAGVGLAVARRVLADHGGTISIESADGAGTTLTLTLPPARVG
jgi:signal transduction histidine kinase